MNDHKLLDRIERRDHVLSGRPSVRGLRISAEHVLSMLASGLDGPAILHEFPELESADIDACEALAVSILLRIRDRLEKGQDWRTALKSLQKVDEDLLDAVAAWASARMVKPD